MVARDPEQIRTASSLHSLDVERGRRRRRQRNNLIWFGVAVIVVGSTTRRTLVSFKLSRTLFLSTSSSSSPQSIAAQTATRSSFEQTLDPFQRQLDVDPKPTPRDQHSVTFARHSPDEPALAAAADGQGLLRTKTPTEMSRTDATRLHPQAASFESRIPSTAAPMPPFVDLWTHDMPQITKTTTMKPIAMLLPPRVTQRPTVPIARTPSPLSTPSPTAAPPQKTPFYPTSDWVETNLAAADDYPKYVTLSDLLEGPPLVDDHTSSLYRTTGSSPNVTTAEELPYHEAICEFRLVKYGKHFPHVMQQFYRCFSWWQAHPHLPAILVTGHSTKWWASTTPFIQGYLQLLRIGRNLTVVPEYHSSTSHFAVATTNTTTTTDSTIDGNNVTRHEVMCSVRAKDTGKWDGDTAVTDFAILDPNRSLRDYAKLYLKHERNWKALFAQTTIGSVKCQRPEHEEEKPPQADGPLQRPRIPRIAILNRDSTRRSLLNAIEIQTDLETRLNQTVPIVSFGSRTNFPTQVSFFLNTDIVISPHGAQLTGMAFLPRCSSVLEIFPSRYLVADYFGSLAAALQIQHGFVYMGHPDDVIEHDERFHYIRRHSRKEEHVDPNVDKVRKAVEIMVEHWKECMCSEQITPTGAALVV